MIAVFITVGRLQWFDFLFVALAFVVIYPDRILEWCAQRFGVDVAKRHVTTLAGAAILLIAALTLWLHSTQAPRFVWWTPIAFVGFFGVFRAVRSLVADILGLKDP